MPTLKESLSSENSSHLIHTLHSILKPFLLRRLKVDVMNSLPPKKEYVLYAPLSQQQRELYDAIVKGSIRGYLTGGRPAEEAETTASEEKTPRKKRHSAVLPPPRSPVCPLAAERGAEGTPEDARVAAILGQLFAWQREDLERVLAREQEAGSGGWVGTLVKWDTG